MKKIDFRKVNVKGIDRAINPIDLDYKGLANYIYNRTKDIGELEIARELYKNGVLDVDSERAVSLKRYVGEAFGASIHEALFPVFDEIINPKK